MPDLRESKPSSRLPRWRRVLYSLLPAVLIFGVFEVGLRMSGYTSATCKWERPDFLTPGAELVWREGHGWRREVRTRLNNLGLRGTDWHDREHGTVDILFLGDSITFGEGVGDGNEFPAVVERLLREQHPGSRVRTINGGVPGFGIEEETRLAERLVPRVSPGLVLLTFCVNDVFETLRKQDPEVYAAYENQRFSPLFTRSAITRSLILHSFSFLYRAGSSSPRINGIYPLERTTPDVLRAWEAYFGSLQGLSAFLQESGTAFGVVVYPDFSQVVTGLDAPERYFRAYGEQHGLPVLTLLEVFSVERRQGVPMLMPDGHPDERAHRMIAAAIVDWLTGQDRPTAFARLFPD